MLDMFQVSHMTDGDTKCVAIVEPRDKAVMFSIFVAGELVATIDEKEPRFKNTYFQHWSNIPYWDNIVQELARSYSPFWNPNRYAKVK